MSERQRITEYHAWKPYENSDETVFIKLYTIDKGGSHTEKARLEIEVIDSRNGNLRQPYDSYGPQELVAILQHQTVLLTKEEFDERRKECM